jgi:hypothetical protein
MDKMVAYGIWVAAIALILLALPTSPFGIKYEMPETLRSILGYINWLIPFKWIVDTLIAWSGIVGAYYIHQMTLRWAKAI